MATFREMKMQLNALILLNIRILNAPEFPRNPDYYAKWYGAVVATANMKSPTRKYMEFVIQYWKDMFTDFIAQLPDSSMVKQQIMKEMSEIE